MLTRLIALLDRAYVLLGRPGIVTVLGNLVIVFLIFFGLAGARPDDDDPAVIDLQLAFSTDRFVDIVEAWGPDVVEDFRRDLWLDALFPVVYSLALASAIAMLTSRTLRAWDSEPPPVVVYGLFVLPFIAAAFDWIENVAHYVALDTPLDPPGALVLLASAAAAIKWALVGISTAVVIVLFVWRVVQRMRGAESDG